MKTIYFMRHGETLFNAEGLVQGQCDSPLTENGIRQALNAKAWFLKNGIVFDEVYCSTLERACDTAELIVGDQPYKRLKSLKEIFVGSREATPNSENMPYPYGDYYVQFGGEDLDEFTGRICRAVQDIAEQSQGEKILIVSHGTAISQFLTVMPSRKKTEQRMIGNCGIVKLSFEEGKLLIEDVINPNQ